MIDPAAYRVALGLQRAERYGQALILGECVGALYPARSVWMPFDCPTLVDRLLDMGVAVCFDPWDAKPMDVEAVYFGTPTIVDDAPLFAEGAHEDVKNKAQERHVAQTITQTCEQQGVGRIVSGLGSGDISEQERIHDMGGGEVVCVKRFDGFEDRVIMRVL